jgi:Skp family chaperone for outer membrane proteins
MQEEQKAMNKLQIDAIGQINQEIVKIISKYAEENKVNLILPIQSVLLRSDAMVMDGYVLDRLNKELPSVKVVFPAKSTPAK